MNVEPFPERSKSSVWAVVLAAGGSSRFGIRGPKQLVPFAGEALVAHLTRTVLSSRVDRVVVVTGYRGLEVAQAVNRLGITVVANGRYEDGQASSVGIGVRALGPSATGAIFIPCDQPYLNRELIDQLIAQFETSEPALVVPTLDGERRSPVIVGRGLFAELETLTGDEGARQLFSRYEDRLIEVPWPDRRALTDFDTLEELEELLKWSPESDASTDEPADEGESDGE